MSENNKLKNDFSTGENKLSLEIKIKVFFYCIRQTLMARFFSLSYPISLYFLYNNNKNFTFFITLGIILISIIYFICYYIVCLQRSTNRIPSKISFYGRQILYCILGYLVQFNLIFFDIYVLEEGNMKINYILCILKILMIVEMVKRVYFYIIASYILITMECGPRGDRCMYVMTFEIVYDYLWYNYYNNTHLSGFSLGISRHLLGLFFSLLNAIFALGSNFIAFRICMIILNSGYIIAQLYSIYWRKRECY